MDKRIIFPIFILVFLLSACAQVSSYLNPTPIPSSGIEGYVTEGPMCPGPVAIGGSSCPNKPYQATISILGPDNQEIIRFETDPSGYFKISLMPGTYILHPESEMALPHAPDQTVVVTPDQFTQLSVIYDTGMR